MSDDLSPEQIKAARALLAWSQQELAAKARVATSTVADFERGVRTPMPNNAQAIREALESEGLQFVAGGVVEKAMLPRPPSIRPGALMRWVNATHLSQWGEQRDGQGGMPELLRRLIFATVGPAADVHFPSDESVQYPGWDGVCNVTAGANFVPDGVSGWEIGCQRKSVRGKADGDFGKRSDDPIGLDRSRTTFVFVTPQRFTGKEKWVAEKKSLGLWHDVRAIDGDDLMHWLEQCPAVAQWLSMRIGRRPQGLRNIEEVWAEWVRATQTPLTPEIVLTDRDDDQTAVLKWLRDPPRLLAVQAEAPDEAMAFLYSSISALPENYRLSHWSRCVVADTAETARQLIGSGSRLIIVLSDPDPGLAQRLVDDGHHIFAAYGPEANDLGESLRRLHRPWRFNLQRALVHAGFAEEPAHAYAHASGRSITVLRRLMPSAPQYRPTWAEKASPELIAAMFAGAWVETSQEDRRILSILAGRPYEQVEEVLAPMAASFNGPIVRSGHLWKVVSLRDMWTQVGKQLTLSQLERFESAFHDVLSTIDRRFATRQKNVYYQEEGEFGEEASHALRSGLTEAMIALAVFPQRAELIADVGRRVDRAVRNLLENAGADLWWSLSRDFHNLAEAAPDAFLESVEIGLEGANPPIMSLFRSDEGVLHPTEYLSNLLWALEMLARSPEYLTRCAVLLAHLDEIDPGGKWSNRPSASLRRIFVIWSPQTYATPAQRLKAIDVVLRRHPDAGWRLLLSLAPRDHDTSMPSSKPNWRDFAPDEPESITWQAVAAAAREIGARLLEHVGVNVERWRALLDLWSNFDQEWRSAAAQKLEAFARGLRESSEIEAMRDKLRTLLQRHRGFKDAQWAMAEDDLKPLEAVFELLQPVSVEDRVRWLFRPGAIGTRPNIDWHAEQAELEKKQVAAAEALISELTPDQLFSFATTITMPQALGVALARSTAADASKRNLMKRGLLAEGPVEIDIGVGILNGLMAMDERGRETWVRALWKQAIAEAWGIAAETRIVLALPSSEQTWKDIESRGADLGDAYWRVLPIYQIASAANSQYVTDHLLLAERPYDAVSWTANNIGSKPRGDMLLHILYAAAKAKPPAHGNDSTMFSYYVELILDYLDTASDVDEKDMVSLEWVYFQVLRYSNRPIRKLHHALASNPDFFVELIKLFYFPEQGSGVIEPEPEDMSQARNLASQAYAVMHDWSRVPGANEDGVIDQQALESWVKRARQLLAQVGRADAGDAKIGEILSAAIREPNQPWPPEPVRDVLETARSRTMERGFEIGVYNRRGVTVRMPHDGGAQERSLAVRYRGDAEALRFDWPRTAACLDRIATTYEAEADENDRRADQQDWL